jgi:hypothetical protein
MIEHHQVLSRGVRATWEFVQGWEVSHPVFKPKPNAYSMCAQESSLHTYRIENGHRITNVTI